MEDVKELKEQLLEHPEVYEPPVRHTFVDGMYCRESFITAGTMAVGATHKQACINMLTEGTVIVSNGEQEIELKAPQTFPGAIGNQKTFLAVTDAVWVNVFNIGLTDIEELEEALFEEPIYKENI